MYSESLQEIVLQTLSKQLMLTLQDKPLSRVSFTFSDSFIISNLFVANPKLLITGSNNIVVI